MNNSSGIYQVDGLLKEKLRGSGLEPYVEVVAHSTPRPRRASCPSTGSRREEAAGLQFEPRYHGPSRVSCHWTAPRGLPF